MEWPIFNITAKSLYTKSFIKPLQIHCEENTQQKKILGLKVKSLVIGYYFASKYVDSLYMLDMDTRRNTVDIHGWLNSKIGQEVN